MKIALIRQKYTPFGGAERYMARLVDGLCAAGHEVHVLAAKWEAGGSAAVTVHRVPVVKFPGWLKALTFSLGCRRIIDRERFDVVFSLERTLRQDVYRAGDGCHRMWLRQKNLDRGVWGWLGTYLNPFQLTYLRLERKLFTDPRLRAIIANSHIGKEEIVSLYGVPPEKIHVVYNGIDGAAFPLSERETLRQRLAEEYGLRDEVRILYVGSGFSRKGVPALVEAAAKLDFPFKIFVVGKGHTAKLKRRAQSLGIAERVVFTGPVRDPERFYLGCDLFVFPTRYDPFSNATLEAMVCGLPVVTTPHNGVSELIRDGEEGVVVRDPLDAEELASAIRRLADRETRRRMSAAAARTAAALTMQENTRQTLAVIEKVMPHCTAGGAGRK
ncbi:glycosyltransferase family 4 protein [Geomonas sp. RF6]|uniref:glycosyltransferase family 4 protein n=1 Tax=Geomonas sp. RF6 TaxID=2897342 RepID=UPI001E2B31D3|nr:glycosyltransferase family 4 protein [Geomonas sp. RF6]UFS68645.1 glycosyltransferase family 4 protein [Geomonas sp. RF6]